jgi:hypothetical protein
MIRKPDGSPYKLKGSLQQFDPDSATHDLFNRYDEEMIKVSGSPVYYYEVLVQEQSIDPLYLEDRSKIYSPCPVLLWAFYEPPQQMNMSGMFGYDTPDEEVVFEMNYKAVKRDLGHKFPLKIGSRIHTPHRGEDWMIIDTRLDKFQMWGAIRLLVHCKKFQDTSTNPAGLDNTPKPDVRIR